MSAPLALHGEARLLETPLLALFCSADVPATVVLRLIDLVYALRGLGVGVIGGFHAPLEREALSVLLGGTAPVVVCPARSIERLRVAAAWREPLRRRRLLVASCAPPRLRRATRLSADRRNRMVVALSRAVMIGHANPGGTLFPLAQAALGAGRPVLCADDPANADLVLLGARAVRPDTLRDVLAGCGVAMSSTPPAVAAGTAERILQPPSP